MRVYKTELEKALEYINNHDYPPDIKYGYTFPDWNNISYFILSQAVMQGYIDYDFIDRFKHHLYWGLFEKYYATEKMIRRYKEYLSIYHFTCTRLHSYFMSRCTTGNK